MRVGRASRCSRALPLPLGVPPTFGPSHDREVRRALTTAAAAGNAPGGPAHRTCPKRLGCRPLPEEACAGARPHKRHRSSRVPYGTILPNPNLPSVGHRPQSSHRPSPPSDCQMPPTPWLSQPPRRSSTLQKKVKEEDGFRRTLEHSTEANPRPAIHDQGPVVILTGPIRIGVRQQCPYGRGS